VIYQGSVSRRTRNGIREAEGWTRSRMGKEKKLKQDVILGTASKVY
jgi:hypothetical protein